MQPDMDKVELRAERFEIARVLPISNLLYVSIASYALPAICNLQFAIAEAPCYPLAHVNDCHLKADSLRLNPVSEASGWTQ